MDCSFGRKLTGQKEKEFNELEKALRTLSNEGLLTNIESRMIASVRELDAKKTALYNIMTSKYKQQGPQNVMEMLKILTSEIQEEAGLNEELSNSDVNQLNEGGKNPLLINTVIHEIFEFLPLNEIKKCRLVNQQWNTIAEPFLRKRGVIHFRPETLKPLDFMHAQEFSLPDLQFTDFKFSSDHNTRWCFSEIQQFFDKWGHNIKSVEFRHLYLKKNVGPLNYHDITSWITKATNLNKLIIRSSTVFLYSIEIGIALDALTVIESISLTNCLIICSDKGNNRLLAPREIHLEDVDFVKEGKEIRNLCFNDYIDFSRCFKIDLRYEGDGGLSHKEKKFDMSRVNLNAKSVHLDGTLVENWKGARGKVDSLFLSDDVHLTERNNLEFKELNLKSGTIVVSVIPHTVEKLRFSDDIDIIWDYSLPLPNLTNLKFLGLSDVSQSNLNKISRFACCANLVEVELAGCILSSPLNLNVGKIPESVKKLKIRNVKIIRYVLNEHQLDTLIIEQFNFKNFFGDVTALLSAKQLTLNVLVISCLNVTNLYITDIFRFVESNMGKRKTIEKIVIGAVGNVCLNKNRKFIGSTLSRFVDKESNYYQFTKQVGESITAEEFEAFRKIGH